MTKRCTTHTEPTGTGCLYCEINTLTAEVRRLQGIVFDCDEDRRNEINKNQRLRDVVDAAKAHYKNEQEVIQPDNCSVCRAIEALEGEGE